MAFSVSALTNLVVENENKIIRQSILGAKTLKYPGINIMAGIKSSEMLNLLSATGSFQSDAGCSYNTSGTTTFTQRQLTVAKIKVQQTFCPDDLEAKYTSKKLIAGSYYDTLPFEQEIVDLIIGNINAQLEIAIWQGDTTNGLADYKLFDGWIDIIDAASPVYATAAGTITTSNVRGIFEDIYAKIPARLAGTDRWPVAFCGYDVFRLLVTKLSTDNLYHYTTDAAAKAHEIMYPGTDLKIVAVNGLSALSGTVAATYNDRIVCTWPGNLAFGTDLANEYEEAKIWYSMDDQNIKSSIKFKAGCQVAFGSDIVTYKRA